MFIQAERTQLYLRCALFGPSGSGKTMSALRIAKGIASNIDNRVAVIDTEARSASKYADRISFDVEDLKRKTIDDYINAMNEAAKAGYKVLVIDSLSHAWRELTEEVDRITQASNSKNSVLSWGKVSPKQKRFVEAILNYPGHIIATMRSKTEWVIGEGKNGKTAPEKLGLAPEQGKGIEYEFDFLMELSQQHIAVISKDRTGKFQDETIEKPGEDFGMALYDWLSGGKVETPVVPVGANSVKPQKETAAQVKPKNDTPVNSSINPDLKKQGDGIIKEIGAIITTANDGSPYFSEDEKEEARQIIRDTKLDEKGLSDLKEFKTFLTDELAKRETKKAA
ncbi:MAG: ATP-binding protein [Treponema sp.]|jgi:nucleoside-triphosphatase THEP1|nr:ATP-binding protein [Treponema sp.]